MRAVFVGEGGGGGCYKAGRGGWPGAPGPELQGE
jgi:hypothetical protein